MTHIVLLLNTMNNVSSIADAITGQKFFTLDHVKTEIYDLATDLSTKEYENIEILTLRDFVSEINSESLYLDNYVIAYVTVI